MLDQVKEKRDKETQRVEKQVKDIPAGKEMKHIPEQKGSAKKLKRPNKELSKRKT